MKVSIIITTYNRALTLHKALESVLKQTYSDIEVLVVDDGSTDGTGEFMRTMTDFRVRYIRLSTNSGASVARNRGIQEASGGYILVWDSDDVLYLHALEKIISVFDRHSEISIVSAPARVLVAGKEQKYLHFPTGEVELSDVLCKKIPSNEKVRVTRSDVMKRVSYKSRNIDFLVNVELIEKGKWYHLDEVLGDVHNDPNSGSLTASRKKKNAQYAIERAPYLVAFLQKHGDILKNVCLGRYAAYCYGASVGLLLSGDVLLARSFSREACRYDNVNLKYWGFLFLAHIPGGSCLLRIFY
ncbi:glycosyltransferase family 2 protein [Candidatus Campbellbacteria bacterium]|nr:MAG: glycosyltransferase family 2 protein [Candidatus Campbellbacteria bacterium]